MDPSVKPPMRIHTFVHVLDEQWIKIDGRYLSNGLLDNARTKGIGAADFENIHSSLKHPRNEFVSCQCKESSLGVLVPRLVHHQAKLCDAVLFLDAVE